ncbi:hypothetical protein KY363_02100 [Candidatus Woesearchaeota archaeon]|nr:hypothetical protein [Candidatus Woesearchaeota archaeon]
MNYYEQMDAIRRRQSMIPIAVEFLDKTDKKALEDLVKSAESEGLFVTGTYSGRIASAYGDTALLISANEHGHIFSHQIPRGKMPKGSARDGNAVLYIGVRKPGKSRTKYRFAGQ